MKDFHPISLFAIAQEFLGIWLYAGIAAAVLVVVLYGVVFYRGYALSGTPLWISRAVGIAGAIAAMGLALPLTQASFAHLLAAIDYLLLFAIGLGVFVGITLALLPLVALLRGEERDDSRVALTADR